ncbi:hypothetical protein [Sphingomonas sp. BK235]|uniref:hypothetical protein n=1 Tax=Sphingomonas sp. BK235 TaxID=2512131 RepID=UPI0014055366|nr:hypothetical protein [Sphingomonas sp. BK235]
MIDDPATIHPHGPRASAGRCRMSGAPGVALPTTATRLPLDARTRFSDTVLPVVARATA